MRQPPVSNGHLFFYMKMFVCLYSEPGKTRPVLIIQHQFLLDAKHPSTIIIPLTTNLIEEALPLRLRIRKQGSLDKDSDLLMDQIRAIDSLSHGPLAQLSDSLMQQLQQCLNEVLGLHDTQEQWHEKLHVRMQSHLNFPGENNLYYSEPRIIWLQYLCRKIECPIYQIFLLS